MQNPQEKQQLICYFDVTNQAIINRGTTIQLSAKAFALLKFLFDHPDQLITKNEILDKIWTGAITVDAVIKNTICEIRRALQDPPKQSKYVQTIHRRGYRFIGSNSLVMTNARINSPIPAYTDNLRHAQQTYFYNTCI